MSDRDDLERFEWIAEALDDRADIERYRRALAAKIVAEVDEFDGPRIASYFDQLDEDRDWRAENQS